MIWLTFVAVSLAHSWLDCIGLPIKYRGPPQFYSNSFYKRYCIGFGRGYPGRFNRHINDIYTTLVEGRGKPNPRRRHVCGKTQRSLNYTRKFPMARVARGKTIKLWYEMDNHLHPRTRAHIYSYARPNKRIVTYQDQLRAKRIKSHVFASAKNCIDTSKPNTWCWAYMKIPRNWKPGVYSFLWNWPWDRNPIGEEYNTCFDIRVTRRK
ncbi:hypothetical protein DSO57_1020387 [Entomophthora muscae]|uniref:Uncharacterized protein n=1 Tax=Entomophthora muscae TaxID=34485 RepID=A0ACC2UNN0_9FUNG|nr:hypothetical protein DSO57_1020387 [Entomophthora muscae]